MAETSTEPARRPRGREEREALERTAPPGRIVYRAILTEGLEELERPSQALFWSGLAAGLSMGFSLIAEGLLRAHLPDAPWTPLIVSFGYTVGFLVVILGRQQLFTENTLTPILPLLQRREWPVAVNVARLWTIVLVANLLGASVIGWAAMTPPLFDVPVREAMISIAREARQADPWSIAVRGVMAGWLIALMVWLLPYAESARIWVIVIVTYLVGLAGFSHIIAGSVEVFALAWAGLDTWTGVVAGYVLPTLAGNIVGGVTLVAALNHAQVVAGKV